MDPEIYVAYTIYWLAVLALALYVLKGSEEGGDARENGV